MIPWQKQHVWFWIAAILVVAGAATLRDTSYESTYQLKQTSENKRDMVYRSQEMLRRLPENLSAVPMTSGPLTQSSQSTTQGQSDLIASAEYEQGQQSETQIVQLTFDDEQPSEPQAPVVWLEGSIEVEVEGSR